MITAFSELYRGHPFIRVPEVVPEASSDRVLTMTYLDGMDWAAAQQADQDLKNTWAEVIARFMNGNYRHANLVHADPHPGNYRFDTDGTVGFLDFGCVTNLARDSSAGSGSASCAPPWRGAATTIATSGADGVPHRRLVAHRRGTAAMGFGHGLRDHVTPAGHLYPDATARIIRGFFDVRDGDHPVAKISVPAEHAFTSRIMLASASVAAGLQATRRRAEPSWTIWTASPNRPPSSARLHHAWVRERGLPGALDHHDHP